MSKECGTAGRPGRAVWSASPVAVGFVRVVAALSGILAVLGAFLGGLPMSYIVRLTLLWITAAVTLDLRLNDLPVTRRRRILGLALGIVLLVLLIP